MTNIIPITHRKPLTNCYEVDTLDLHEVNEGYQAGLRGETCSKEKSRSFWHGWRNGSMDAGIIPIDEAARQLVSSVFQRITSGGAA